MRRVLVRRGYAPWVTPSWGFRLGYLLMGVAGRVWALLNALLAVVLIPVLALLVFCAMLQGSAGGGTAQTFCIFSVIAAVGLLFSVAHFWKFRHTPLDALRACAQDDLVLVIEDGHVIEPPNFSKRYPDHQVLNNGQVVIADRKVFVWPC